ncbi:MAG: hypothetical protein ACRD17_12295 [Terriglobales bacterium]
MKASREELLSLLRARGLEATVRRGLAPPDGLGPADALTRLLTAGPPPRAITELIPASGGAGLTSIACHLAALAARREGARIAWADPLDQWDPASAQAAGVALERVLWLRGGACLSGLAGLSRWQEVLGLLIQAGGMHLVVADFSSWPAAELRRIPRSAWFRLLRGLERSEKTALLTLAPEPLTQSCAGLVVGLRHGPAVWPETAVGRLRRVPVRGQLLRQRFSAPGERRPAQSAPAIHLPLELRA